MSDKTKKLLCARVIGIIPKKVIMINTSASHTKYQINQCLLPVAIGWLVSVYFLQITPTQLLTVVERKKKWVCVWVGVGGCWKILLLFPCCLLSVLNKKKRYITPKRTKTKTNGRQIEKKNCYENTHAALEAILMPLSVEGDNSFIQNRFRTTLTPISELVLETIRTDRLPISLSERLSCQTFLATGAHKMILMPILIHCLNHFL